jgi:hypothetical protein
MRAITRGSAMVATRRSRSPQAGQAKHVEGKGPAQELRPGDVAGADVAGWGCARPGGRGAVGRRRRARRIADAAGTVIAEGEVPTTPVGLLRRRPANRPRHGSASRASAAVLAIESAAAIWMDRAAKSPPSCVDSDAGRDR